jgi:hypothetical protein
MTATLRGELQDVWNWNDDPEQETNKKRKRI